MTDDDKPAIFRASYTNFKNVPSRGVVQVIFEVAVEQYDEAYRVLGIPIPGQQQWFAIAKLVDHDPSVKPTLQTRTKSRLTHWDMKPSQRAGDRCADARFQTWLLQNNRITEATEEAATAYVRKIAGGSRSNLGSEGFERQTEMWDRIDRIFDEHLKQQRFEG